jgi:hypothetical protein
MEKIKNEPLPGSKTCFIGIDVGFTGGLTILNEYFSETFPFPIIVEKDSKGKNRKRLNVNQLIFQFENIIPCNSVCVLEQQQSRPKQGVSSVFSLGRQYGQLEMLMTHLCGTPPHIVSPVKWKKFYPELLTDNIKELKKEKKESKDKKEKSKLDYQIKKHMKQASIDLANEILNNNYRHEISCGGVDSILEPNFFTNKEDGLAESFLIAFYGYKNLIYKG